METHGASSNVVQPFCRDGGWEDGAPLGGGTGHTEAAGASGQSQQLVQSWPIEVTEPVMAAQQDDKALRDSLIALEQLKVKPVAPTARSATSLLD